MNYLLSNLEVALDESHLVVGEKLFEEGKVNRLFEGERNLWMAEVDGFEVEMQVSPSRVKAVSCECDVFLREKMCGHVAGGLFALRRHFSEKKPSKKRAGKKKPTVYHKLTTSAILDNVKPEELRAFVGTYAKQNRNFALALSTRFAASVPLADNHAKYRQVINQLLQGIRKKNNKVSAVGLKQFIKTCRALAGQADDSAALNHYAEAWAILRSLVETIPFVVRNLEGDDSDLLAIMEESFRRLDKLMDTEIPPLLRAEIWEFLLGEAPKKNYRTADFAVLFLTRLPHFADDEVKKVHLSEMLDENWKYQTLLSPRHMSALLSAKMGVLESSTSLNMDEAFLTQLLGSFTAFQTAVKTALENTHFSFAGRLMEAGGKHFTSALYQEQILRLALQLALAQKKGKKIVDISEQLLLQMGDVSVLKDCRAHYRGNWEKKLGGFIKKIKALPPYKSLQLLPKIYVEEGRLGDLHDFLLNQNSLDLTAKYDQYFIPEQQEELAILYRAILDDYLSQHFGSKPSIRILALLDHLRKIGGHEAVEKIVAFIRKKYPRRMELALEMMTV